MRIFLLAVALVVNLSFSLGSHANGYTAINDYTVQEKNNKKLKVTSKKQAAKLAKARYSAKVLSVKKNKKNGTTIYKVKLLTTEGVVFFVNVNGITGRVSKV